MWTCVRENVSVRVCVCVCVCVCSGVCGYACRGERAWHLTPLQVHVVSHKCQLVTWSKSDKGDERGWDKFLSPPSRSLTSNLLLELSLLKWVIIHEKNSMILYSVCEELWALKRSNTCSDLSAMWRLVCMWGNSYIPVVYPGILQICRFAEQPTT